MFIHLMVLPIQYDLLVFSVHSHHSCSLQPKVVLHAASQSSTRNLELASLTM